jgi:S-formylglutathione hydrolase
MTSSELPLSDEKPEILTTHQLFGGQLSFVKHSAKATQTDMVVSIFVPPQIGLGSALIWLSGLTCSPYNFTEKAGAYKMAAQLGLIIVAPDTSPRGEGVSNNEAYDLGQGAGFYVNATQAPWAQHFQMETYITQELPAFLAAHFPIDINRIGVSGHSMGGHGALSLGLRHPHLFQSISAFSPIASVIASPWGQKAMSAYLGDDTALWTAYDAASLMSQKLSKYDDILIDQGLSDPFLDAQLRPEILEQAALDSGQTLSLRRHIGYDHSYYFIASFIDDHLRFHADRLVI